MLFWGAIPDRPKVNLHNPVLAHWTGDDFLKLPYQTARGELGSFVLFLKGSIPKEHLSGECYVPPSDPIPRPANSTT